MEIYIVAPIIIGLLMILMKAPIGAGLMAIGLSGIWLLRGFSTAKYAVTTIIFQELSNTSLVVLPLFILSGALMANAGLSQQLYNFAQKWLGWLKGGLAIATVATCAFFGAVTGSSIACSLVIGKAAIPEMKKAGNSDMISCSTVAASGTLGMLIPPSSMLVLYGITTETSIMKLLIAGIVPGILTAIIFMIGIHLHARLKPEMHAIPTRYPMKEKIQSIKGIWAMALMMLSVVGGIFSGLFTISEVAALSVVVSLLCVMATQDKKQSIINGFREGGKGVAEIYMLLLGGYIFSKYMAMSGLSSILSSLFLNLSLGKYGILVVILLTYIILGMFIDPTSMLLITMPVVFPVITTLGFDSVWFGIVFIVMAELGNITPPFGLHAFVIKTISPPDVGLGDIFKGLIGFVGMQLIVVLLLVLFPSIALWLPGFLG